MNETKEQQAAVRARGKVIVSASAGSGKTRVMVNRYVDLILQGADVRSMLAVTFTNKAAGQMRERIRNALSEEIRRAEGETRTRLKEQLRALPLADISTIHAFCGRLIRTYFYLVGADPAFRVVGAEDAEGQSLSARAMDQTFEEAYAEGGEEFRRLLAAYFRKKQDTRLRDMVRRLYTSARGEADYEEILTSIAEGREDLFEQAADLIKEDFCRRAADIVSRAEELRTEDDDPKAEAYLSAVKGAAQAVAAAADLFSMRELSLSIPQSPRRTAKMDPLLFERVGKAQKLSKQVKELYAEIGGYHARDEEYRKCAEAQRTSRALAKLALEYGKHFSEAKREAGALDYGDLEHLAIAVLNFPEAAEAVHARYRYLFVDEYQDVNPMQERILSAVGGEDVFLVGDEKQAIYGFRGSRAEYFRQKVREYAQEGGALLLSENFRSAPAVLDAVNSVFVSALKERYVPMRGGALYGEHRGEVFLYGLAEEEKEILPRGVYSVEAAGERPRRNAVAECVAGIVEKECGRKEGLGREIYDVGLRTQDGKTGGLRQARYGDVAVLVRKNTKAAGPIVRALSERGIPVTASAEVNICDYFEVRLLIDWLSFLDNAEQDIPMASAMLSLLGGFTDRELALIRLKTERVHHVRVQTFREACMAYIECYREGNDPLCKKAIAFFEKAEGYRRLCAVHTASEMLVRLLADGLEAQIAAKGDCVGRFSRVRKLISESEGYGVHAFLKRLKDCGYEIDLSETGGENAVRVLTIHAAKGLEFPIVIFAELDMDFRGPDYDDVMWTDRFHIAPRAFDFGNKVYSDTLLRKAAALYERRQTVEGERNLLYVGMTRACCRLHMIFEKPAGELYRPDDAKRLSDFIPREQLCGLVSSEGSAPSPEPPLAFDYRAEPAYVREIEEGRKAYPFEASTNIPVKDSATGLMRRQRASYRAEGEEPSEDGERLGGECSTETGIAYHAFLEHVDFSKTAAEELGRMAAEGILSAEEIALLDPVRLQTILSMPCFAGISRKRIRREQRFLVSFPADEFSEIYGNEARDEVVFQGAIDLLIEDGGKFTVVDYKFSFHSDERIKADYAVQMKLYRKTVAKIMKVPEAAVRVRIVNIARGREIEV